MYLMTGTTAFPQTTMGALTSKDKGKRIKGAFSKIDRKYNGKNISILNDFGVYKLSINKNN